VTASPHGATQPGIILGGMQTTPHTTTSSSATIFPASPAPGGGNSSPSALTPVVTTPSTLSNPAGVPPTTRAMSTFGAEGLVRPGVTSESGLRPLPPGAIIGGTPGVNSRSPGVGGRSAVRVNPVGGVIEPRGPQGASESISRGTHGQPLGNLSGRLADTRDSGTSSRTSSKHWDPDNPWETAVGVPPVVLPPITPRIDPGPAIGLQ
jgi:hypothetical protein